MTSSAQDGRDRSDLTPLAWVQDEVRRTLEGVHKSLRRSLREFELRSTAGQIDPAIAAASLGPVATQLHQVAGVLQMVGLREASLLARASEGLVRYMAAQTEVPLASVEAIEKADFALLTYVARLLGAAPVSPLALFPAYRRVQEQARAERIHPADFWPTHFEWQTLPSPQLSQPAPPLDALRTAFETALLRQMRQSTAAHAAHLAELCVGLAVALRDEPQASFWQLAAAHFEAQALGLIDPDAFVKRLGSRLLAQLRNHLQGHPAPADRLVQDLLFYCAQSGDPPAGRAPHLRAVRTAYGLDGRLGADYLDDSLGQIDPGLVAQALRRVQAAKDSWGACAEGEMARASQLDESFGLVTESLQQLFPSGEVLGQTLQRAAVLTLRSGQRPSTTLGMEVATSLLYVEAALDDGVFAESQQAERLARLAQRVQAAATGQAAEPLEVWMEELFRRVSDRQTLGSVVHELRHSLTEVERQMDEYFRKPEAREQLIPVPGQLAAMRGVFSVLGLDQASLTCLRMRDEVDRLSNTEVDPSLAGPKALFERLANNLGQLGFLIDMLSVQAPLAKTLFRFNEESGELEALVERETAVAPAKPSLVEQARAAVASPEAHELERLALQAEADDRPALATAAEQAAKALQAPSLSLADLDLPSLDLDLPVVESAATAPMELRPEIQAELRAELQAVVQAAEPAPAPVAAPSAPLPESEEELDEEMLEIFLEEASEVIGNARDALHLLVDNRADKDAMTTVRRSFHTLKGSSKMVGLMAFGEAAWACEQLYNARLGEEKGADEALLGFSADALDELAEWRNEVENQRQSARSPQSLRERADALRLGQALPAAAAHSAPALAPASTEAAQPEFAPTQPADALETVAPESVLPASDEFAPITLDFGDAAEAMQEPEPQPATEAEAEALEQSLSDAVAAAELLPDVVEAEPAPAQPEPEVLEDAGFELDLSLDAPAPTAPQLPEALPDLALQLDLGDEALPALEIVAEPEPEPDLALPVPELADETIEMPAFTEAELSLDLSEPELEPELDLALNLVSEPALVAEPEPEMAVEASVDAETESAMAAPAEAAPEMPEAVEVVEAAAVAEPVEDEAQEEPMREIGPLRISQTLFGIFIGEADHQSSRLAVELADWSAQPDEPPPSSAEVYAHALAGNAATVGYESLSHLARALEHALGRAQQGRRVLPEAAALFARSADEIAHLLHQFAAGFLKDPQPELIEALQAFVPLPVEVLDTAAAPLNVLLSSPATEAAEPSITLADDAEFLTGEPDQIDDELWEIFEEEASELLHQLHARLRDWTSHAQDSARGDACMRTLHTFKGGARLAGAMHLGEMAHRLESAVAAQMARSARSASELAPLQHRGDELEAEFERQRVALKQAAKDEQAAQLAQTVQAEQAEQGAPVAAEAVEALAPLSELAAPVVPVALAPVEVSTPVLSPADVDWSRFAGQGAREISTADAAPLVSGQSLVRVRASLLDRLASQAGEVSIRRARMESELSQMKTALLELDDNLERLRTQLRELEVQAEAQISSRQEQAKAAGSDFDPLEFDRYTRFQEVTRMLAESVNDVATVQRSLQRNVAQGEDELAAQSRLTRELQDDLLSSRMVEFDSLAERLHRVVRQAAREGGKQVQLDLQSSGIELDRGVLERLIGAFEHLLRNSVAHGIETPAEREKAGKPALGTIRIKLSQEGNQVLIAFSDDGAGLNLARIREKAGRLGLLPQDREATDHELMQMIYAPGFSTASQVTELAGRGVGMDVVRAEVNTLGGYVLTRSQAGRGAEFDLRVPLTTALTQVVLLRCGEQQVAVPASLVDSVLRLPNAQLQAAYASGQLQAGAMQVPLYWMGGLLSHSDHPQLHGKHAAVVLVHSGPDRIAIHVDEVVGNQEVVVKNLGPQLIHVPGLAGISLLASGSVALIYNPVALAERYGAQALARAHAGGAPVVATVAESAPQAPLILVVDDSLTVRRVTQRFLEREGYRVQLAKDGLDAMEQLAREELPDLVLSDIEMPRMDGFDLVRNLRADTRLQRLPVVMITSRIAAKHREYAEALGVQGYLGKPYDEEVLKGLIRQYTGSKAVTA